MDFSKALEALKKGKKVTREGWGTDITVEIQFPDKFSKMTLPYIYMNKKDNKFPLTLSCESILADDWVEVKH